MRTRAIGFSVFDTALGACGIAWSEGGVAGVQLPEPDAAATRARLRHRFPDARESTPTAEVQDAIDGIVALLGGARLELAEVRLDFEGVGEFEKYVYQITRTIPPGATLTYGEIARRLGDPTLARAVGQALGRNPFAIVVPCHRVLAAGGRTGGFSAGGGVETKLALLRIEGAVLV
jgi:methylated-DNA-[protein]-cysteine S-methyltransferase